jgi:hypothetical protein
MTAETDAAGALAAVRAAVTTSKSLAVVGFSETVRDVPVLVDAVESSWRMLCPVAGRSCAFSVVVPPLETMTLLTVCDWYPGSEKVIEYGVLELFGVTFMNW